MFARQPAVAVGSLFENLSERFANLWEVVSVIDGPGGIQHVNLRDALHPDRVKSLALSVLQDRRRFRPADGAVAPS